GRWRNDRDRGGPGARRAGARRRRGVRDPDGVRRGGAHPLRRRALPARYRSSRPETDRVSAPPISTRVVKVDPVQPDPSVMRDAGALLEPGGLVGFPTESFYGLGANALDARAVARVFAVKGRPEAKPLLVLVDSVAMAESLTTEISSGAREL